MRQTNWFGTAARALMPLVGIVFGPLLLVMGVRTTVGAFSAANWKSVPAVITASSVESSGMSHDRTTRASVRYSYWVGGRLYFSDRIRFGDIGTRQSAATATAFYRPGDTVVAYVDMASPQRAVLQQGGRTVGLLQSICGAALVMLWLAAVARERRARNERR